MNREELDAQIKRQEQILESLVKMKAEMAAADDRPGTVDPGNLVARRNLDLESKICMLRERCMVLLENLEKQKSLILEKEKELEDVRAGYSNSENLLAEMNVEILHLSHLLEHP